MHRAQSELQSTWDRGWQMAGETAIARDLHIKETYKPGLLNWPSPSCCAPFYPHSFTGVSKKDKRLWSRKNFKLPNSCRTPKLSFNLTYYLCYCKKKKTTNKLQSKMQMLYHQQLHLGKPFFFFFKSHCFYLQDVKDTYKSYSNLCHCCDFQALCTSP